MKEGIMQLLAYGVFHDKYLINQAWDAIENKDIVGLVKAC